MSRPAPDPVYMAYLAELKDRAETAARIDAVMAKCRHWGHAPSEWKYSCCACSGMPGGCDNCSDLLDEEMGFA